MNFPVHFEINSQEQLDILHCALSEFTDSDKGTQEQADILTIRLDILRKTMLEEKGRVVTNDIINKYPNVI